MYSLDGVLVLALLVVCTCAYITKVPRLKSFFLSEKKGFFGVFYKGNKNNMTILFFSVASTGEKEAGFSEFYVHVPFPVSDS